MSSIPESVNRELLTRIQMEYLEMPGLRLTSRQARRLWNLDEASCVRILAVLVELRFLARAHDGSYLRTGTGSNHAPIAL